MTFYGNENLAGAVKMVEQSPRITEQDCDGYATGENYAVGLWSRRNIEAFIEDGNTVNGRLVTEQDALEEIKYDLEVLFQDCSARFNLDDQQRTLEHVRNGIAGIIALLNKLNAKVNIPK